MAKAFGAFLRFLFVLLVIGLIGYNTYEIAQLRAEVAALKAGKTQDTEVGQGHRPGSGTQEQIAEAQSHVEKATALLKEKRFGEATKEMQAASDAAQRAGGDAQAQSRTAIANLQGSLSKLSNETGALWKQAEGAAATVRTEGEKVKKLTENNSDDKRDTKPSKE